MFNPVDVRTGHPEMEEKILSYWRDHDVFRRTIEQRKDGPGFVFYEGPPTANGRPHVGHVMPLALKDLIPRYKAMRGYHVLRKAGWDTHGLPVELEVEKALGITGKPEIERYGVKEFVDQCKASVFKYKREWERVTERIGFWVDLDDAYVTYTNDYVESVWWALSELWRKGLLYQGHKVVPYCPRCGTALSSHEVAQGYAEVEDPSVFVRMPVRLNPDPNAPDRSHPDGLSPELLKGAAFLVWTTTPWTLPSNTALAVNPASRYALVEVPAGPNGGGASPGSGTSADGGAPTGAPERLILAAALVAKVFPAGGSRVLAEFPGEALLGLEYVPPYDFLRSPSASAPRGDAAAAPDDAAAVARVHSVIAGDFVTLEDGTGIVHIAPAFGEDDLRVGRRHGLPVFQPVDTQGRFTSEAGPWAGRFVKEVDPDIIADLAARGLLFRAEGYRHSYPFCWRCDTPLLYYARSAWFIRMTALRSELLANNERVNWYPEHLKRGRFGDWLENVVDWNLSRERYWGTPLPIWRCDDERCGHQLCVGSFAELARRSRAPLPHPFDPHKPAIDDVVLTCPVCGGEMHRVPEVIDCWFDAGSMPFAQWHYPFEHRAEFEESFPADYICEAVDQTRGWFYSLLAISTALFGGPAYLNCLVTEHGLDDQGAKMSKHKGNVVNPWDFLDRQGADALRWYVYSVSQPWVPKRFSQAAVTEAQRLLDTLRNVYGFFVLYANLDGWDPRGAASAGGADEPSAGGPVPMPALAPIDRWILSRLQHTVAGVRAGLGAYDIAPTTRLLAGFVEDLSNWYVRRCRRRFWKAESDADKAAAYTTLYRVLVTLAKVMAPFTPFMAEEIYLNLDGSAGSVHLEDYPEPDQALVDDELEQAMGELREYVALGRAARNRAGIKTRQPLPVLALLDEASGERAAGARADGVAGSASQDGVSSSGGGHGRGRDLGDLLDLLAEELNVKEVVLPTDPSAYVRRDLAPRYDRLGPRFGKATPGVVRSLLAMDPAAAAAALTAGRDLTVPLAGGPATIGPDEVEVRTTGHGGYLYEGNGTRGVALSIEVSDELLLEGLARELVNRLQRMRREAGYKVDDTVTVSIHATATSGASATTGTDAVADLARARERHGAYIRREVLAADIVDLEQDEALRRGFFVQAQEVEGEPAVLAIRVESNIRYNV